MSRFLHPHSRGWPATIRGLLVAAHPHLPFLIATGGVATAILTERPAAALVDLCAGALCYAFGFHIVARINRQRLDAAGRDGLTGLPTRAATTRFLDAATRDASDLTVALADVDGLGVINNSFGYAAGDQYLTAVAERLAMAVPDGGELVRQGGGEFAVLAVDADAGDLAVAIAGAMAEPLPLADLWIRPRISVGIAISGGGSAAAALACADAALSGAKFAGGNAVRVYQPDRDGQPHAEGIRPLVRRRDLAPATDGTLAWVPTPEADPLAAISAHFTPAEIEALVSTAAEAVYGNRADLSVRQLELAERAWTLLQSSPDA